MAKRTVSSVPDRKISETFLQFAAPLLHDLPSEAPERRARDALQVSFTAWNAVIFADVLNDDRYLNDIRHQTADNPAGMDSRAFRRSENASRSEISEAEVHQCSTCSPAGRLCGCAPKWMRSRNADGPVLVGSPGFPTWDLTEVQSKTSHICKSIVRPSDGASQAAVWNCYVKFKFKGTQRPRRLKSNHLSVDD